MSPYAFPANHFDLADGEHGMTLRDYFAAKAMAQVIGKVSRLDSASHEQISSIAKAAYYIADAMLAERNKGAA